MTRAGRYAPAGAARQRLRGLPFTRVLVLLVAFGAQASLFARSAWTGGVESGAKETETKVKVAYIYNFPKFIDWPDDGRMAADLPMRICILGTDPMRTTLGELSVRRVKDRPIKVALVQDVNAVSSCHLLYISRSEEPRLPLILQKSRGTPVLTVSDIPGFVHRGGMIGFVTEENRVRIEISLRSARQAGLKIHAKLIEVARAVL